jgi:hypothetical protein
MKNFLGIFSILAIASPSFCQRVCTADDVRVSLLTVEYLAGQMQSFVDIDHSDIDPSGVSFSLTPKLLRLSKLTMPII